MQFNDTISARVMALFGTATVALALAACGDKKEDAPAPTPGAPISAPAAAPEAPPAAAPAPAASEAAAEAAAASAEAEEANASRKLNTYIACYNGSYSRAHDAMSRYRQWVKDMNTGPTGKERVIYGTYTIAEHNIEACAAPVLGAADAKPAMPELDQAAKAYSAALAAWGKTLVEANTYYERENYKDDAMAKGKAMHADMVKNYAAFDTANKQFSDALETENDKRQLQHLAEVEKAEGRQYTYWHGMTMFTAKKIVNTLSEDKVDLAKAETELKAFEDTADSLAAYAKSPDAKMPMMWSMLDNEIERYRVAAKKRLRAARENSQGDSPQGEGSRPYLVERYNAMVQSSNNM